MSEIKKISSEKPTDIELKFEKICNSDIYSVKFSTIEENPKSVNILRALILGLVKLGIEGSVDCNKYTECITDSIKHIMKNYTEMMNERM